MKGLIRIHNTKNSYFFTINKLHLCYFCRPRHYADLKFRVIVFTIPFVCQALVIWMWASTRRLKFKVYWILILDPKKNDVSRRLVEHEGGSHCGKLHGIMCFMMVFVNLGRQDSFLTFG